VVASIATTAAQPAAGQPVAVTVTVKNQGNLAAGAFSADFYKDRAAAPGPGIIGDVRCAIAALAAGASTQCTGTVTYTAAGTFSAWAQVDTAQAVVESNEGNNVSGPRTMTVGAAAGPDLVVTSVGNPPASAAPGKAFAITDTVKNQGATPAAQSTTRFYLSLDAAKDAGDTLLTGSRAVATLAAGAQSAGTTTVTIPLTAPPGTYHLLACADDTQVVAEASDANNCRAAAATIVVGRPDLVETAVSNPPAAARPGTSFAVTDTVRNQGTVTSSGSAVRYYLSADAQKSPDDRLLTGSRSVPTLAPGAASTQTVTVTIPPATPPGTYGLLACADDTKLVTESDEGNNCLASVSAVTVALPDLVQQTVSSSGGPFRRGTAFTVSDTVVNDSRVGTPSSATTRYYLSTDTVRNTGDILLTGARTVPILAPFASSSAAIAVTIPSATLPGTYVLLACADDTKVIAESNDTNNCRASGTAVVVAP
jgi:subtilase family serine protease